MDPIESERGSRRMTIVRQESMDIMQRIDGAETKYYRHSIRKFDFTELEGKEKWTAYKFTKNVYDYWMPKHFERICSAIDEIPADISFAISQSELSFFKDIRAVEGSRRAQ